MDRGLVERARQGDQEAYELLARDRARPFVQVAYRILRDMDAAEDAAQHALVAVWRELPRLRDLDRFDAWCHRLVVRASLDEARRHRRHAHVRDLENFAPSLPDASRALAIRDQLDRAFLRLSPEHRAVVVLHHWLGYSLTEIAEVLDVPYGTVGSRLHYALRELRVTLGADEQPPIPNGRLA